MPIKLILLAAAGLAAAAGVTYSVYREPAPVPVRVVDDKPLHAPRPAQIQATRMKITDKGDRLH
jgi:hypothetical protein